MRIALLPSAYAPAVGGVEVLTASLAQELTRNGHDVQVWTGRRADEWLPDDEVLDGIRVKRFVFPLPRASVASMLGFPVCFASSFRPLLAAARELEPEVLHVQCFSANGAYATALSRLTGCPLIVTLQGETVMDDHDIFEHSQTLRLSLRLGLRRAAAVTGCSDFVLRDASARFGLDRAKARVIFNGVDLEGQAGSAADLPFGRYVLGLGRIVRKKGFDLLLRAFAEIGAQHPDVGVVIAGDGPEREPLAAAAAELGIRDRVHFTGRLGRSGVASIMNGAEVFVMPSRIEPFGIVVLEAWRAGVPAIVSSRGGTAEFVTNGETGLVVDPFDHQALAASLSSLLESTSRRTVLARAARNELSRFWWSSIAGAYEDLYLTTRARSTPS